MNALFFMFIIYNMIPYDVSWLYFLTEVYFSLSLENLEKFFSKITFIVKLNFSLQ